MDPRQVREAARWTAAFLALAVTVRAVRYLAQFPFWGDESAVALNLLDRGYISLAGALDLGQVAPLGFLWSERALVSRLGPSEIALRSLPFAAGIGSVFCFWRLARAATGLLPWTSAPGQVLPLAIFAVSYYPIRYGAELKPYAIDILVACVVPWLAASWLCRSDERHLLWLAAVGLLASWFSYPSVFIAGGAVLGLFRAVVARSRRSVPAYALFVTLLAVGFLSSFLLIGRVQKLGTDSSTQWLLDFWASSFPPSSPLPLAHWLVTTHLGIMFAYPNGGPNGESALTLVCFLLGAWAMWTPSLPSRRAMLGVVLAPFGLALAAAAARQYPYGGHPRIVLFLGPAICLLAGIGLARAVGRLAQSAEASWLRFVLGLLFCLGLAEIGRDCLYPYQTLDGALVRGLAQRLVAPLGASDQVVSLNQDRDLNLDAGGPEGPQASFRWYLRIASGDRFRRWPELDPSERWSGAHVRAVLFTRHGRPDAARRLDAWQGAVSGQLFKIGESRECASADCGDVAYVRDYVGAAQAHP